MAPSIPSDISTILGDKLSGDEKQKVTEYITSLQTQIEELGGSLPAEEKNTENQTAEAETSSGVTVTVYDAASGAEDFDKAGEFKQQAADAKSNGDHSKALELYNQAVLAAPPSALLYSNRAICLMKLGHYKESEQDCNRALEQNPDSGKALKTRGQLRFQHLQDWHGALSDLGQAQSIDFDPEVADMLKELSKKRVEEEKEQAKERLAKEEKMRKKAEEIRKVREEEAARAKEEQQQQRSAAGGMPGMGGMGGMPGMGGMGGMPGMGGAGGPGGMDMGGLMGMMMGDPEIQAAMQNPKVVAAFGELMNSPGGPAGLLSNPAKLQKIMSDPEVGPILQKIMGKLGGGGGGMPGMGGMGGMGGGGMPGAGGGNDDDIPDLDMGDLPDLVD
ncbi:unnamed protein product [Cylindrotheca closterium]|uniref:STI1 domain-containing protein n=1 Tax=Cylindrotheca closterium TaxID=2856 RepID=A0AAD2JGY3_9STRA|nr:unnamed protein product [Cylindrotheca closterium]